MTTADSLDAKPAAFENAVLEDRFYHILTASRRITASRRRQRRDENAVEINRKKEEFSDENLPFVVCRLSLVVSHFSAIFFRALHIAFSMTAYGCSSLSM